MADDSVAIGVAQDGVAIGVATRTGAAVAVALGGCASAPRFTVRRELALVPAELPAQPYHAAAECDLASAEELIDRTERCVADAAEAGLRAMVGLLPSATTVLGVGVVVKAVSVPASVADVLRSHAWMHAAEGVLYREAVLAAARRCGWAAHAVDVSRLPAAQDAMTALGRHAGRPWRRIEKDAARAAITLLPTR